MPLQQQHQRHVLHIVPWAGSRSNLLLLLVLLCVSAPCCVQAPPASGGSSTCANAAYTTCPSALAAVQLLTSNSSLLPISNAQWTGPTAPCTATNFSYMIIPSFPACNYWGEQQHLFWLAAPA